MYEVRPISNETNSIKYVYLNIRYIDVIPFKVLPSHHYTLVPTFFPVLITVLEGFDWNVLEYPRHGVLDVSYGLKMRSFHGQFCLREQKEVAR
jgi:hypothetical protein